LNARRRLPDPRVGRRAAERVSRKARGTLKRITSLFIDGAANFNDDHVQLFDDVFSQLIAEIETKARAEFSCYRFLKTK
jgi:hypothetical protein